MFVSYYNRVVLKKKTRLLTESLVTESQRRCLFLIKGSFYHRLLTELQGSEPSSQLEQVHEMLNNRKRVIHDCHHVVCFD